jgi:hypothetical protein
MNNRQKAKPLAAGLNLRPVITALLKDHQEANPECPCAFCCNARRLYAEARQSEAAFTRVVA